jgi:hypothetical protein
MFADSPSQGEALAKAASELALVLDLDFLPERYRPRRLTLRSLRPALFVLGFALLLIPLGRFWGESRLQSAAMEGSLAQVQADLQGYQPLAEERAGLEARIASAQAASAEIQTAYDSVDIQDITWNRVLSRALSVRPQGVEVVRLSQEEVELVLEGLAAQHVQPSNYAEALAGLGDFAEVVLRSVTKLEPLPDPELPADAEPPEVRYYFEISAFLPVPPPVPTRPRGGHAMSPRAECGDRSGRTRPPAAGPGNPAGRGRFAAGGHRLAAPLDRQTPGGRGGDPAG